MIDQEFAESPEGQREEIADLREKLEAARAELQRLQSSPAPVVGGMPVLPPLDPPTGIRTQDDPVWGMSGDLEAIFKMSGNPLLSAMHHGIWQGYDVARSRLPAIKPGEVVVSQSYIAALENAANQFCAACIMVGTEDCPRGLHACGKGCSIWRLDAPRINALCAQATTAEKETPC